MRIHADMENLNRRRVERFALHSAGFAVIDGNRIDLKTHDISLDGSLIEFIGQCVLDSCKKFDIYLDIGFIGKASICRVTQSGLFGIKFDRFEFSSDLVH